MKISSWRAVLVIGSLIFIIAVVVIATIKPKARQGLSIVEAKMKGSLPDIGWNELFRMARSGEHFGLRQLATSRNPYVAIHNPYNSTSNIFAGSKIFQSRCASCHGAGGAGGPGGPSLRGRRLVHGNSSWAIFRTISLGIRGKGMPANDLPWLEKWQLVAYVVSLSAGPSSEAESQARSLPVRNVDYGMILNASNDRNNWLTYSGSYNGHRFSSNDQITVSNVSGLRLLWAKQYNVDQPYIETSPLVVDGYMFVTLAPDRVEALNANTGALIWSYNRDVPDDLRLCCGIHNRGLAVLGSMLYFGTLDAHLIALDIHTGQMVWDVKLADYKAGYSLTGAPLALKNLVVTGVACGEFGGRGFIEARNAITGKEVWKFDTIPQAGQPGHDTWAGNSAQTGGGPAWLTGSFDPSSNLLYWPVGNPSPDYDGSARLGDNLYTDSVVALDADTGSLRWYFQFTPHDVFDWDSTEILVLFDGKIAGKERHLLAQANRNGFFYLLDARTGAFLHATSFAKQTWADGVDSHGRPQLIAEGLPRDTGTPTYPGVGGATNWQSPSYSPITGLMYVPAVDRGGIFTSGRTSYHRGDMFLGGSFQFFPDKTSHTMVVALKPITGKVNWEYRNPATTTGGLLSTGGGLVFGSQDENFFALNAHTGKQLWHVGTGGRVTAAPVTFLCAGKQLITIAAGHDLLTFGL